MPNWNGLADAAEPPPPEELRTEVIAALERLEVAFRPLVQEIPLDTLLWTGPEDVE
jgi:hypothetical protein